MTVPTPSEVARQKLEDEDKVSTEKHADDRAARIKSIDALAEKERIEKEKVAADLKAKEDAAAVKAAADKKARIDGCPTCRALSEVAAALRGKGHEPWLQEHFNAAADQLDQRADQISAASHGHGRAAHHAHDAKDGK